jgi:iron complex outermembrane receptor protein
MYEAAIFANNIADQRYLVYSLDLSTLTGSANQTYAPPRWLGGSLTARF